MPSEAQREPEPVPTMIGFRLRDKTARSLAEQARQMDLSPHELARHLVTNGLYLEPRLRQLEQSLDALHAQLHQVREELASIARVLLVTAGKISDEQAHEWVDRVFNQPCSPSQRP